MKGLLEMTALFTYFIFLRLKSLCCACHEADDAHVQKARQTGFRVAVTGQCLCEWISLISSCPNRCPDTKPITQSPAHCSLAAEERKGRGEVQATV